MDFRSLTRLYLILICLLFFPKSMYGKEKLHLVAFKVPRFIESDDSGEFILLAKSIAKELNLDLKISIAPPQRALLMLKQGSIDGFFPGLGEFKNYIKDLESHDSSAYYFKKDYLFVGSRYEKIDLNGKRLCLTNGYPYDQAFLSKHNFRIEYSSSDKGCLKMLSARRVDLFMCELVSGSNALGKLEKKERDQIKVLSKPISSMPVFFSFQKNMKGEKLASQFSSALDKMKKSGELQKIFHQVKAEIGRKYQFPYDPLVP